MATRTVREIVQLTLLEFIRRGDEQQRSDARELLDLIGPVEALAAAVDFATVQPEGEKHE